MKKLVVGLLGMALFAACSNGAGTVVASDVTVEDMAQGSDQIVATDALGDIISKETVPLPDVVVVPDLGIDFAVDLSPDIPVPQCEAGEGCFLDSCSDNESCQSGWCVEHMGDGVCTITCEDECPDGWTCKPIAGGPDLTYVCVSDYANLCKPCATTEGCKAPGAAEDVCLDYGDEGSFCGGACESSEDCPWGFSCLEGQTVEGVALMQCMADAGVCPCTAKSVALALTTPCVQENEFGSCAGKRVCTDEGLTLCDAQTPLPETCNGLDDDCDASVDEPDEVDGNYVNLCDDGNDCSQDICGGEDGCSYEQMISGECVDGDPCTAGDHCEEGQCVGLPIVCDDGNICTDDFCDGLGGCTSDTNSNLCDDGDPCTVNDLCVGGECSGFAVECQCLSDEDCMALDDGNACNGQLICKTDKLPYQCVVEAGSVVTCPEPEPGADAICRKALCAPETGVCSVVADHEGFACEDGDACTVGDVCQAGDCLPGGSANCSDNNPCTDDSCSPELGCVYEFNSDSCSDGNVCTIGDACADGQCLGGAPLSCDDGNVCNGEESCSPETGCLPGTPLDCNDGNPCNGIEVCDPQDGCQPGVGGSCDDGNPCTDDFCTVDEGCINVQNQAECDDGNLCTTGDHCDGGACAYEQLEDCDDLNVCTTDSCDPKAGCVATLNSAPCNDQDLCTVGDHCHLGACISAAALTCDDNNPCTDDACDADVGCTFTPNQEACDDGSVCTLDDQCVGGWCLPGPPLDCADESLCTDEFCDAVLGCQTGYNTAPCNDGDECTAGEACLNGDCEGGVPVNCSDDDVCTDDLCDSDSGCYYTLNVAPCDDSNLCTLGDACLEGVCVPGPDVTCGDDNLCTDDFCEPLSGCVFEDNSDPCNDDDACTVGDVCGNGQCQPGPDSLPCDDLEQCTTDSCAGDSGCVFQPVQNGTPCLPDGTCQTGQCVPNILYDCQSVLDTNPNASSGVYSIDPDGEGGAGDFQVFCEMGLDDGGWTLVMSINTSDGHMSKLVDNIWTAHSQSGNFNNRWTNDYKSLAATVVDGEHLLVIVRDHSSNEGGPIRGWRSWKLDGQKAFQDFFDVSMGGSCANSTGGCNSGHSGDGRQQTNGVLTSGQAAPFDTFTNQADEIYSNSYYGCCGDKQDGFRLSSHYRWANNSNVGLGLQMDNEGDSTYTPEAGALLKKDTYGNPQRYCGSCGSCQAYPDGSNSSGNTKAAIGSDHYNYQCSVGESYRYEWYIR